MIPEEDIRYLWEKFEFLRQEAGLTFQNIADILGVSRQVISAYANGGYSNGASSKRLLRTMYIPMRCVFEKLAESGNNPRFTLAYRTVYKNDGDWLLQYLQFRKRI